MKKILSFFILLSLIFLTGCVQKDLIDIYVFADRFSKYSENFEIETDNLTASEENGVLSFPLAFSDKFLVTVRVNDKTSLITSVSVTYMFEKKRTISDNDFSSLREITDSAIRAFTKLENTDDIFDELSLNKKQDVLEDCHTSYEKDFYKFSFVSNEVGIYFSASTERR